MDIFISSNQEKIKKAIKEVDKYDRNLSSLSSWWSRIALIGKINSLEVASTILDDMESTLSQFHELQAKLVNSLLKEHTRKVISHDQSRCQMAIDVLIRNLFERTADIGFLSTDSEVVDFLNNIDTNQDDRLIFRQRLQAYTDIYSVYNDALLLTPSGEIVFQLTQPSRSGKVKDAFIFEAVKKAGDYVEYFGTSELMNESKSGLLYANAVLDHGKVIGVMVLCFRFNNELEGIVDHLSSTDEMSYFLLSNGAGDVLFAPENFNYDFPSRLSLNTEPKVVTIDDHDMIQVGAKGQSYQEYSGPKNWHMSSLLLVDSIDQKEVENDDKRPPLQDISGLISDDLFNIRKQSMAINDDLELIVLNGIITAARKEAIEFMPVLEAIKKIGRDIDAVFADSIESLFSTIISAQLNSIRLQASLAVDIMDRNLYERANDSRWWGLNNKLAIALSSSKPDTETISQVLASIHELYTVYHTLYVFDKSGRYMAFSDDKYIDKIGQPIEPDSAGQAVFNLEDIYEYSVSPFVPFDCYAGEPTYIYNAAIRHQDGSGSKVGGIGIVFDSTAEFSAILNDVLPRVNGEVKKGCIALFTNESGIVISSSSDTYVVGDTFLPDIDMEELNKEGDTASIVNMGGHIYIIGAAKSQGYREYKRQDGYENTVIAWVLMPC